MKNKLLYDKLFVLAFLCLVTFSSNSYAQIVTFDAETSNQSVDLSNGETHQETITISNKGNAPLSWSVREVIVGAPFYINKPDYADGLDEQYQDIISENVILARRENQNIFNIAKESNWQGNISPALTLWSEGISRGKDLSDYSNLNDANGGCGSCILDDTYSMYIPSERRFFDFEFTRFTNSGRGGFEYSRREIATWAETSKNSGNLLPNESEEIQLTLSPLNLPNGEYNVNVEFITNDTQSNGNILVPLVVRITDGVPEIITESSISLQNQMIGGTSTTILKIGNEGTAQLNLTDITSNSSLVTFGNTALTIGVGEIEEVEVYFTPETTDVVNGEITINSDDSNSPKVIAFTAQGLEAPQLKVSTDLIKGELIYGNSMTASITIENTGAVDLKLEGSTEITGSRVTFSKESYTDFDDINNQDHITPSVSLSRKNRQGLYNPKLELGFDDDSPIGTLWSTSKTSSSSDSDYSTFMREFSWYPPGIVDRVISMKSVAEERYFDFIFSYWAEGNGSGTGSGGGFSYTRYEVPKWLAVQSLPSTLSSGTSTTVTFDITANVIAGVYYGDFVLITNDPINPEIRIPFELKVNGNAAVNIPSYTYDFDETYVGETSMKKIEIENVGTDTLFISDVTSNNSKFNISSYDEYILGLQTGYINVEFAPTSVEEPSGKISFQTSDLQNSSIEITVTGQGVNYSNISVQHDPIIINKDSQDPFSQGITIENTGGSDLDWIISGDYISSVKNSLPGINARYNHILNEMNSMTIFEYDGGHNYINDGYNDMYDNGNYIATNYFRGISYSDNVISDGTNYFGEGTKYYTRHFEGLFFLAAELNGVEEFEIYGNLGADGYGSVDTLSLETSFQGKVYKAFVKRVYGTSDPAIHHMIIVEKNNDLAREYSTDTDDDYHKVTGLENTDKLYYLLFARNEREPYGTNRLSLIFNKALESITGLPIGIELSSISGSITKDNSEEVIISSENPSEILLGYTEFILELHSNDPENERIEIPITIQGSPKIVLNEDYYDYNTQFISHPLTHNFTVKNNGVEPLIISNISVSNSAFTVPSGEITIATGETYILPITFDPSTSGDFTADVTLTTNDVNNQSVIISVEGSAEAAPMLTSSIDFTELDIYPGTSHVGQLTLGNTQGINLDWDLRLLDKNGEDVSPNYITIDKSNGSISSGNNDVVSFTFDASNLSVLSEEYILYITTNDPTQAVVQIPFRFRVNDLIAVETIEDILINEDVESGSVDISSLFETVNDEELSYLIVSSNVNVLTVNLEGNTLMYYPKSYGSIKVSIAATYDNTNYAYYDFNIRVNGIIVEANPIEDQVLTEGFGSKVIDFTTLFTEPDNDEITYSVALSNDNVVTATLNDTKLTLTEKAIGEVTITITAKEEFHSLSSSFTFEVKENEVNSIVNEKEVWSIYPNPTSNSFKIKSQELGELRIYSTAGYLVKTVNIERVGQPVNVQGLSSGLYIVSFDNQKSKLIIR
ncbi:choice-of-anchor D domain-containing protein [Flammeovirga sp. MY04]|uniref:Ig-like domain-containing protein n=1 Tax=Flammeovirga sp. MY04 TaxID=1191459 RepID=UPI00080623EC|nr:choice-of-anchor D domain-containing protein [Flammeovirga sp. MY04]ANQ51905.1 choice-of-anchor D domain-containing protein [Flammeovirga sp. MY04]